MVLLPRSLRLRLTLTFVALGSVLVVVAALGVGSLLRLAVWRPLDVALEEEAASVILVLHRTEDDAAAGAQHLPDDKRGELAATVAQIGAERDLGPTKFVVVREADGRRIAAHGAVPSSLRAAAIDASNAAQWSFLRVAEHTYRIVEHPTPSGRSVAIGVRADRQLRVLERADFALVLGALLFLLVLGALAWRITSRGTAEIDAIADELESLEADSLDRRVSRRDAIEVDRLAVALNRMLGRLEQAVSHLRRFTADAAHELRTPLAALRARLDAALAREPSVDAFRDGLLDAIEQTDRLSRLAEDLLTLSAVESAESLSTTEVDLSVIANEVAEFLEPVAEEQGRELTLATDRRCIVRGSEKLLKRVLLNLLDNAFRHTPAGKSIAVEVRRGAALVRVAVRDQGQGIAECDVARLFQRFGHSPSEHAGAGLGLALCQEIVRRHGGRIDLRSALGAGTEVIVELPACGASADEVLPTPGSEC